MTVASVLQVFETLGPTWTWVIAGVALAGAEIIVPGVFLIWLGLAALATGLASVLLPMPWQGQVLLFAGLALVFVGIASRLYRGGGDRHAAVLNRPDRGLIGREGVLSEPIVQGTGRIRFDDTLWRVAGPDLPAGARVRVRGIEGTILIVRTT